MSLIMFTTEEVRAKLARAIPIYTKRHEKYIEGREAAHVEYKERREAVRERHDREVAEWEANKEARIKELAQERFDNQSFRLFRRTKSLEEIEEDVRKTTFWTGRPDTWLGLSYLMDWFQYPPCYAKPSLDFCLQLARKLDNHDPERLVGLTPAEIEMLEPDEDTTDMGTTA